MGVILFDLIAVDADEIFADVTLPPSGEEPPAVIHGTLSHKLLLFGSLLTDTTSHVPDGFIQGVQGGCHPADFKLEGVSVLLVFHDVLPVGQYFLGRGEEAFLALEQNLFAVRLQFVVPEGFGASLRCVEAGVQQSRRRPFRAVSTLPGRRTRGSRRSCTACSAGPPRCSPGTCGGVVNDDEVISSGDSCALLNACSTRFEVAVAAVDFQATSQIEDFAADGARHLVSLTASFLGLFARACRGTPCFTVFAEAFSAWRPWSNAGALVTPDGRRRTRVTSDSCAASS